MTFWAKFLTVLILVLSLVFAGMSMVLFAKRADYRKNLEDAQTQLSTLKTTTDKTIGELQGTIGNLNENVDNLQKQLAASQQVVTRLQGEVDTKTTELTQKGIDLTAALANVETAQTSVQTLTESNKALLAENTTIRDENVDLTGKLADSRNKVNSLQTQVAQLTETLDTTQKNLADARETISLNEEVFAELSKRNIEAQQVIAGLQKLPDIRGKVLQVDSDQNLVVLNVGRNQGVRKNFEFKLWRDDQFLATVYVDDVQDNMSAARIVTQVQPVQRGDNAWTRLGT